MIPFMLLLLSYNCAIHASASDDQGKHYVASRDQKNYKVPESPPIIIQASPGSYGTSPALLDGLSHLKLMRQNSEDMKEQREKKRVLKAKAEFKKCMLAITRLGDNAFGGLNKTTIPAASNSDEDSDDNDEKYSSSDGDLFNMEDYK